MNNLDNSVNGSLDGLPSAASLGQTRRVQQAASDRHQASVCNQFDTRAESCLRIGTWNVNTLYQAGKLNNVEREMKRLKLDILGVAEVRWTGADSIKLPEGGCFIYSGGQEHKHGVGVMLNKRTEECLTGFYAISERVLLVRLKGKPFDVCVIQVYAPTSAYDDAEVDQFYEEVMKAKQQCKRHDIILVMGDLNAKVGKGGFEETVGPYGLGERNERGDKWVEWCVENEQVILNTWYRHHPRRLWTWQSPGDHYRNQIDYVTINKRFRNVVTNTRTYPGADCNSDHVPIVVDVRLKLKKKKQKRRNRNQRLIIRC